MAADLPLQGLGQEHQEVPARDADDDHEPDDERLGRFLKKWIVLVRTDIRALAGSAGGYNPMLREAATIRIDLPAASTVQVIARILDALARIETGSA